MRRRAADQVPRETGTVIVGTSPVIERLRRQIEQVAPTDATVLIVGERGTGKELVAEAVQRGSRRRDRPFVKVNCAAVPTELLASELFGHERGAFTGALQRTPGLVIAAAGGTLLLDEVGDLPLPAQAMLLRFLQEREVRRVGATRTCRVDVRIIAATNKDLTAEIGATRFRADVYDRLAEVVLAVPPLRDRREDIPALVDHFLAVCAARHGLPKPVVGPEARRTLQLHGWPGNVRELERTVSRAVVFAEQGQGAPLDVGLSPWAAAPDGCEQGDDGIHAGRRRRRVRETALALAHRRDGVRRGDLVASCGVSGEAARRELRALVAAGLLVRAGQYRGARYVLALRQEHG